MRVLQFPGCAGADVGVVCRRAPTLGGMAGSHRSSADERILVFRSELDTVGLADHIWSADRSPLANGLTGPREGVDHAAASCRE